LTVVDLVIVAAMGLLYPYFDRQLGAPPLSKPEWSNVMRCVAVFVGINHASAVSLFRSFAKVMTVQSSY